MNLSETDRLRWRLILGAETEQSLGMPLTGTDAERDQALEFLYGREYGPGRNRQGAGGRGGGSEESTLSVPDWINAVNELFPQRTIERLEKDALERYEIQEMVTNADLLARAQPSPTLLKAVLHTKHLMNPAVLALARELVRKVVQQLMEKFAQPVRNVFLGAVNRRNRSWQKLARNFDARATIRKNLKHYDPTTGRLQIQDPIFFSRVRRQIDRWQIIIVVDQSGSMVDSVIHSAVTAAIFFGIPALKPHLILFDTNIVDVTDQCTDPVETLMKVQLGGGTDIGSAMHYASTLINNPRKAIVILITDFYEGGDPGQLLRTTRQMIEGGTQVLGLAALDEKSFPSYDKDLAQRMANLGAHVGAMTPGELANWVATIVR
ncbi:MAG: VWA domain-containing protein [Gemmataceae bacterium]